jgi:purine-binding chemotaxis protein CheW
MRQYLTFQLEGERYAVSVGQVREVLEYTTITKLPRTEPFMKGLINLRGKGVPVVDLRTRFGMPEIEVTKDTSIIVLEVGGDELVVGAMADAVQEVVELDEADIEPAPRFGARLDAEFIAGIGRKDEGFVVILDTDRIFDGEEMDVQVAGSGSDPVLA